MKLGSRATGNLLHAKGSKFLLLLLKSLEKLGLVLVAKFVCLDGSLVFHLYQYPKYFVLCHAHAPFDPIQVHSPVGQGMLIIVSS